MKGQPTTKPSGTLFDADASAAYDSVEHVLDTHIPAALLPQVKRILYGSNEGASPRTLEYVTGRCALAPRLSHSLSLFVPPSSPFRQIRP